jgi:hypothetical protein
MARRYVSWRRAQRERSAATRKMDVDWDELTDGRIRCLQVGKHYEAAIGEVEDAAKAAAAERGMVACTTYENVPRMKFFESYVWVQFADHEIDPSEPCPCGEVNPVTIHPSFARCPSCGARLAIRKPKGSKRRRPVAGDGIRETPDTATAAAGVPADAGRPKKQKRLAGRKKAKARREGKGDRLKGTAPHRKTRRAP